MLSLLDGFSGYNQVLVSLADQLKTTFRTPWGTYAYMKMPFGLINAGATFQRAMDATFRGLINHSVIVYLDDINVFSKNISDHISHLRKVLEHCRKFGISLNPKKTIFVVIEGISLGFVVSKEGIMIDPERTQAISRIHFPSTKKSMQSFMGKINFVRRFVPIFLKSCAHYRIWLRKIANFHGDTKRESHLSKLEKP